MSCFLLVPEIFANSSWEGMPIKDKVVNNKSDDGEEETSSEDAMAATADIACAEGIPINDGVANDKSNNGDGETSSKDPMAVTMGIACTAIRLSHMHLLQPCILS
jgi:hypothetical protein